MLLASLMAKDSRRIQFSETRRKLDYIPATEDVTRNGDVERLKSVAKCDLRKSLAWDSAFFTSPGVLDPEELLGTLNLREDDTEVDGCWKEANKTLPSVSSEPERTTRINVCTARRSLAWDSSFFTNAGVLDPEELSLVNGGFNKAEAYIVPKVKEELLTSTYTSATVKSSRLSIASLEIDLFEDLRASARKSGTGFNVAPSNVMPGSRIGMQDIQSSKELDASARRRSKPLLPHVRQRTNACRQERIRKDSSITPQTQRVFCSGVSTHLSYQKPPKVSRGANNPAGVPTDRTLVARYVSNENKSSAGESGRKVNMHKKPCLREKPGSTPTQKSPCSGCALSEPSAKSSASALRSVADSRLTASVSAFKTPSRYGRNESLSSSQPRSLLSTPKSSRVSPASSTNGWSDSATSLDRRSRHSTASPDMTSCRAVVFDSEGCSCKASDSEVRTDQHYVILESKTPMKHKPVSDSVLKDTKPSGLRMPSPKIGFFDAENSQKENRGPKPHSCPETGSNSIDVNKDGMKKRRHGTSQAAGTSKESPSPIAMTAVAQVRLKSKAGTTTDRNILRAKRSPKKQPDEGSTNRVKSKVAIPHDGNKENIRGFENGVDTLSRDVEAMNINSDFVIELKTGKGSSC